MHALLLPRSSVRFQHLLHPVEERVGYQGLVLAVVFGAIEVNFADVVAVGQQGVDVGQLDRPGGLAAVREGAQAFLAEGLGEGSDGPLAAGVGLEGPLHQPGPVGVDDDGADFTAVFGPLPGVEVADRGAARSAALDSLLGHAFEGFTGQVGGVELRDTGHDGVQQLPWRGVVNVLLDRDQLRPAALEFEEDVGVVAAVAGEAVHLVEDDVVDVAVVADPGEHALKLRPFGGLGRLATIDVLVDDARAQGLGLAVTGFALGGQRVAVGLVGLDLFEGRDSQVDDGSLGCAGVRNGECLGHAAILIGPSQRASAWTRPVWRSRTLIAAWETSKWRARLRVLCSPLVQARLSQRRGMSRQAAK